MSSTTDLLTACEILNENIKQSNEKNLLADEEILVLNWSPAIICETLPKCQHVQEC